jgi:hypothetical protein
MGLKVMEWVTTRATLKAKGAGAMKEMVKATGN